MSLLFALTLLLGGPSDQTLIYYNARIALREGRPVEALKLWLLRNAVEQRTRAIGPHDADLRSVTWAALGELGLCQDGLRRDLDGVRLWPLAQHNWLVREVRRPEADDPGSPFDAFRLGKQQRFVSVSDVLDAEELEGVQFGRMGCFARVRLLYEADESVLAERRDRRVNARLLRHLLRIAWRDLDHPRVIGGQAIAARIFDLDLRLVALEDRVSRKARREKDRAARRLGLAKDAGPQFPPGSEQAQILEASLGWSAEEWLTLSPQRRQFLVGHALRNAAEPARARRLLIAVIDRLIEQKQGRELQTWIAHFSATGDEALRAEIWRDARGARLLALDGPTGFSERGAVALHRGTHALATGRLPDALRLFAQAMRWAEDSRQGDAVRTLGRRWLSFVASQFKVTDALLDMLETVLPRGDQRAVLDDQMWHAALQADAPSFERVVARLTSRGAGKQRADLLAPLAKGDVDRFLQTLDDSFADAPHRTLRFLKLYLDRLQGQPSPIRRLHRPLLERLEPRLRRAANPSEGRRGLRRATARREQITAILDGLAETGVGALDPERAVFAGSLRVAPSDPLPWPFEVAPVRPPPVFAPLKLEPVEWRDATGALVFGWRVGDAPEE